MLNVTQTAAILKVSDARVRQLIAEETLPAYKCGHLWLINEEDVLKRATTRHDPGRPRKRLDINDFDQAETALARPKKDERFHKIYSDCKKHYKSYPTKRELSAIRTKEEKAFRIAVPTFFSQK